MNPTRPQLVALAVVVVVVGTGVAGALGGFDGLLSEAPASAAEPTGDPCGGPPAFEDVADEVGIDYESSSNITKLAVLDFNGVYTVDYNDDGWTDVLLTGDDNPVLYENRGGSFVPAEEFSPASYGEEPITTALFFDYDSDGREDLLLLPWSGSPVLLANTPDGFRTRDVGLDDVTLDHPGAVTAADYDGDGDLDVFIGQYGYWSDGLPSGAGMDTLGVVDDNGHANILLRNTESGFENVTAEAGIRGNHWTLAASFVDFTGDGLADVHVANDFSYDVLYVNRGDGTFDRVRLGNTTDRNAMSSEVADFDGDGRPDVFVTNIYVPVGSSEMDRFVDALEHTMGGRMDGNNLLLNRGNGSFVDGAEAYGVRKGGWGWAAIATDFDNDGDLDLFHATQNLRSSSLFPPNVGEIPYVVLPMYWEGDGDSFTRHHARRLGFEETDGRGTAAFDYDNDGDQDVLVTDLGGSFKLYENRAEGCHSLALRVEDETGGPALGARVNVTVDGETRHYFVTPSTDHLSQEPRALHVGVGERETVDRISVEWPDGTTRTFEDVRADGRVLVSPSGIRTAES